MSLVSMKRDKADVKATAECMPCDDGGFPYGLCLSLDKDELDKLGISTLPKIGAEFHLAGVAIVTRVSQSADLNSEYEDKSISLQITMLEMVLEKPHAGEESETVAEEKREMKTLLG